MYQVFNHLFLFFITLPSVYCMSIDTITKDADVSERSKQVAPQYEARLSGGHPGYIRHYPYIAYIFPTNCGGTIIGIKWILTIWDCNAAPLTVSVGVDTIEGLTSGEHLVVRSYRYEHDGVQGSEKYPILVLELRNALQYSERIQPIAIGARTDIRNHEVGIISGFGATGRSDVREKSNFLQTLELPILDHDTCYDTYIQYVRYMSDNPDLDFCAGYHDDPVGRNGNVENFKTFCQGDRGAGLIIGRKLVGIAVKTMGCGHPGRLGIFASVPFATAWLYDLLKDNITYTDTSASYLSVCHRKPKK